MSDLRTISHQKSRKREKNEKTAAKRCTDQVGKSKYKAALHADRLTINGHHYTVNNIDKVPEEVTPKYACTPQKNGITAVFSKESPLSNHYHAILHVDNKTYT